MNYNSYSINRNKFWNNQKVVKEFGLAHRDKIWEGYLLSIKENSIAESPLTALDIGCGGGKNTMLLLETGFAVMGSDISKQMIRHVRNRVLAEYPKSDPKNFIVAPMDDLPFDKTFDVVISNGVLHNALTENEFKAGVEEISRTTKKGGSLLLNVFTADRIDTMSLKEIKDSIFETQEGTLMTLLTSDIIRQLITDAGFEISNLMQYERQLDYGVRNVLRMVAVKG